MKWELEEISLPLRDEKKEWVLSNRKKTSLYMEAFVLLLYLSLAPTYPQGELTSNLDYFGKKGTKRTFIKKGRTKINTFFSLEIALV
jgi:hypothetical protein